LTLPLPCPPTETEPLARKPNYQFEKRRKELDRKAKRDARAEDRRRRRAEGGTDAESTGETQGDGTNAPGAVGESTQGDETNAPGTAGESTSGPAEPA